MNLEVKPLFRSKMFWAMVALIAGAIGGYFEGEISGYELLMTTTGAIGGIFFRKDLPKARPGAGSKTVLSAFLGLFLAASLLTIGEA